MRPHVRQDYQRDRNPEAGTHSSLTTSCLLVVSPLGMRASHRVADWVTLWNVEPDSSPRLGRACCKVLPHGAQGLATMADALLLLRCGLGESALEGWVVEVGVVAEAVCAAWFVDDLAFHFAAE